MIPLKGRASSDKTYAQRPVSDVMASLPIIPYPHDQVQPRRAQLESLERLTGKLLAEEPQLQLPQAFLPLVPKCLDDAPTLHLDDLSEIVIPKTFWDPIYLQDRARLRAQEQDFVASCAPPDVAFERYCERHLGLGTVTWLHPQPRNHATHTAAACWTDRRVRHSLVKAMRTSELRYLHPHMGNFALWSTASLLHQASRRPLKIIAPPPGLTESVNDKIWFSRVVGRLFGEDFVPRTVAVYNLATLAQVVKRLAQTSDTLVIKLPTSAGGAGNMLLDGERYREYTLTKIKSALRELLGSLSWQRLLVSSWEEPVLGTPSTQLWIPPVAQAPPVIEGLFEQLIEGPEGIFVGFRPCELPDQLTETLLLSCWLLARLFQSLGYIGRCSFDTILVGSSLEDCQLKFIESNGRWGGTSLPMTLMNRLFGHWSKRPFTTREYTLRGLERFGFDELLEHFSGELFDARSGCGDLILYSPGALKTRSGIDAIILGETWQHAELQARSVVQQKLERLVAYR
jgi:hypothetical protein